MSSLRYQAQVPRTLYVRVYESSIQTYTSRAFWNTFECNFTFKCEFIDLDRSRSTGDDLENLFKCPRRVCSFLGRQPHGRKPKAQLGDGLGVALAFCAPAPQPGPVPPLPPPRRGQREGC
jgi:hypothetical protein